MSRKRRTQSSLERLTNMSNSLSQVIIFGILSPSLALRVTAAE